MELKCFDLGTNSVLYLHARIDSRHRLTPFEFRAFSPRLGKSLTRRAPAISPRAQQEAVSIIKKYISPRDNCLIAGTSALREAKNTDDFVALIHRKTGRRTIILNGHEEARLIFCSVKHYMSPLPPKTIICDIGGGSTEFIFAINGNVTKKISIPAGAVSLTEKFGRDTAAISLFVRSMIKPRIGFCLIGSGGTVTSLGAISLGLSTYRPNLIHGLPLSYDKIYSISNKLKSLNLSEKKNLLPFDPSRADIITAGSCILQTIMENYSASRIKICDRGLIYGLALNYHHYKSSGLI